MPKSKGNILVPLLAGVAIISIVVAAFLYWQNQQYINTIDPSPDAVIIKPTPPISVIKLKDWKTYTNNKYGYSIQYPANFTVDPCVQCNRGDPEQNVQFKNADQTIFFGITYAHQGSLCANNSVPCQPADNLHPQIGAQAYDPEEYYMKDEDNYIFNILALNNETSETEIGIWGEYKTKSDAKIVNQILSTFKFTNQGSNNLDWQTHTDPTTGISISYPKRLTFTPDKFAVDNTIDFSGTSKADSVHLTYQDFSGSLDKFANQTAHPDSGTPIYSANYDYPSRVTIGNRIPAISYSTDSGARVMIFVNGSKGYIFYTGITNQDEVNNILDSIVLN